MKPTVLIFTTTRWFPTARLGMALANAGFSVEALCPSHHPLALTKAVRRMHQYSNFAPLQGLVRAIAASNPELIVPGNDLATHRLHELHIRETQRIGKSSSIAALIERSLGSPESFAIVYERASFTCAAEEAGVRVPRSGVIRNLEELRRWTSEAGFPVVLKADGSSGGEGVKIVATMDEAQSAFRRLHSPPLLARAAKRALLDGDTTLLLPSILRRRPVVSAQAFVVGREANSAVVCHDGAVLAALHFEVINKTDSTGHATVLRMVEHPEMTHAVETMVRRLNLSGMHGFDFMVEEKTGRAYLIEINPRSTQVGHLTLGPGRDLPAALMAIATATSMRATPKLTENDTIALFPQEWTRDPASPYLQSGYHDVPWDEPELIRSSLNRARKKNRSLTQHDWDLAVTRLMEPGPKMARSAEPSAVRSEAE